MERIQLPLGLIDIYAGQQLYMEPLTHRLTVIGIPGTCSTTFAAKYQNALGKWFTVTPDLRAILAPKAPYDITQWKIIWEDKADPSRGGIYSESEMLALEAQQTIGSATAALGVALARQLSPTAHGAH